MFPESLLQTDGFINRGLTKKLLILKKESAASRNSAYQNI